MSAHLANQHPFLPANTAPRLGTNARIKRVTQVCRPPYCHVGAEWIKGFRRGAIGVIQVHRRINSRDFAESTSEPSGRISLEPGIYASTVNVGGWIALERVEVLANPVGCHQDVVVRPQDVFAPRLPNGQV